MGLVNREDSVFIEIKADNAKATEIEGSKWNNAAVKKYDKRQNRMALKGLENESSFYIKKMEIPKSENRFAKFIRSFHWVRVKDGDKEVYLNINSLSKRLLLSKEETSKLFTNTADQNTEMISQKTEKLSAAMTNYRSMLDTFKQKVQINSHIDPTVILKVALCAEGLWLKKDLPVEGNLKEGAIVTIDSNRYLMQLDGKRCSIIDLVKRTGLGKGGYGTVDKVRDLVSGKFFALKMGKEVHHEARILRELADKGVTGVQQKPFIVTTINGKEAMVGELYGLPQTEVIDLFHWITRKDEDLTPDELSSIKQDRQDCCKQLWDQLKQFQAAGMYNGDIKPENILLSPNQGRIPPDGDREIRYEFAIADWGSALPLSSVKGELSASTPTYLPISYSRVFSDPSSTPEQIQLAARAHDRYCIGCAQYLSLTGQIPFKLDKEKMPIGELRMDPLKNPDGTLKFSKDAIKFLELMTKTTPPRNQAEYDADQKTLDELWSNIQKNGWEPRKEPRWI